MSKRNKTLLILCFLFLIGATIYNIADSLAVFESAINVETSKLTGAWNIYINDVPISGTESEIIIDDVYVNESEAVASDKLAPGLSAYFDLNIIPTGTDVSIKYDIAFDFSGLSPNLVIDSIQETTGDEVIETGENEFSNVFLLEEIKANKINTIRVNLKWENMEEYNETDTQMGMIENNKISIPMSIRVIQYMGEEL